VWRWTAWNSRAAGLFSSRSTVLAETAVLSLAMICCSVSVGVRGAMVSGRMMLWGVAVADDLEVEVVGHSSAGEHGVELLSGLLPG